MNKNSGIKILSGSVALVVILILFNSKSTPPAIKPTTNTNNFNEAIASQFNDNIRDVSARLQETEKRLEQMQQENKTLQTQLQQPKQDNSHKLKEELLTLKDQIASIAQSKTKSYPVEGKVETKQIKDLDELLDKPTAEHKELSLWDGQKEKEEAQKPTPLTKQKPKKNPPVVSMGEPKCIGRR